MRRDVIQRLRLLASVAILLVSTSTTLAAEEEPGVYVMRTDGSGETKVVSVEGATSHLSPRWSHDGKRLAFETVDSMGKRESFVVNLDGTELKNVGELGHPDWSPDDKQLVLDSDESELFVQNVDGSGKTRLTIGAWPRWSPDAGRIAFCDQTDLRVLDFENGDEYPIYHGSFAQRPGAFDWSHDGKRLALFTRTVNGGPRELYIVNADGTSKEIAPRYSRPGMVGGHVTWSPDDKQLFFTIDSQIYSLEVEGGAEPKLIPNQTEMNRDPAISPSGEWIAFVRRPIQSTFGLR